MQESKKIVLYRSLAILLLLIPFAITMWFMIRYIQIDAKSFGLHIFASVVLLFFTFLQIFLLAKNMKNQLIIYNIAFNENKTVNKTAIIFVGVGCIIALAMSILFGIFCLTTPNSDEFKITAFMLIFSIFLYMLINCVMFLIYPLFFKEKKFDVRDLLK